MRAALYGPTAEPGRVRGPTQETRDRGQTKCLHRIDAFWPLLQRQRSSAAGICGARVQAALQADVGKYRRGKGMLIFHLVFFFLHADNRLFADALGEGTRGLRLH